MADTDPRLLPTLIPPAEYDRIRSGDRQALEDTIRIIVTAVNQHLIRRSTANDLPPDIAYTDIANIFTQTQTFYADAITAIAISILGRAADNFSQIQFFDNVGGYYGNILAAITGLVLQGGVVPAATGALFLNADGTVFLTTNAAGGFLMTLHGDPVLLDLGRLKFPATQNPSANANTLDDYEEGTWTPVDASGAGLALTSATDCTYTKVGRLVTFQGVVTYPVTASALPARIGGLPFTAQLDGIALDKSPYTAGAATVYRFVRLGTAYFDNYLNSGAAYTNVQFSATTHYFSGFYEAS